MGEYVFFIPLWVGTDVELSSGKIGRDGLKLGL